MIVHILLRQECDDIFYFPSSLIERIQIFFQQTYDEYYLIDCFIRGSSPSSVDRILKMTMERPYSLESRLTLRQVATGWWYDEDLGICYFLSIQ